MDVELSFERPICAEHLLPLYFQTDWADQRTCEDVEQMLTSTQVLLGAWNGDRLVAFARAVIDGRYRALIDDVIVGGKELGKRIMHALSERLLEVEEVFLRCDEDHVSYYQKIGYRAKATCLDWVDRKSQASFYYFGLVVGSADRQPA